MKKAKLRGEVNRVGVIGFAEFAMGGVLAVEDKVVIQRRKIN